MAAGVANVPKKNEPNQPKDQSAKISWDVLRMARVVVSVKGGSVTKLISDLVRPLLARMVKQLQDNGELIPPHEDD